MIKKTITLAFDWGNEGQLRTDPELNKRVITGIILRPNGKMYECACGLDTSWHQDVEIEKFPEAKKVGGFRK